MKRAYCLVRRHLDAAAQRMKRRYDLRVLPQQFRRGQWVLYYNPRKFQGKQQKWQRKFSPHLITRELPPVNYLIQKTRKSRPFVAHVDKLKPYENDNIPKSWLSDTNKQPGTREVKANREEQAYLSTRNTKTNGHSEDVVACGT